MKLNAEEFEVIKKVGKWRTDLWHQYLKYIDPKEELKVEMREMLRSAFIAGCSFSMESFYSGQGEEKKKNRIIKE